MYEETKLEDDIVRAMERGKDPALAGLSDEDLTERLQRGASDIAAATFRWLELVHEIVVRGVWADWGFASPAGWLSWSVGMSRSTARDHVRVALRLPRFERTAERFANGELSFSKVRAITRADRPELEDTLLTYAEHASAAQLDRIVSETRRMTTHQQVKDGLLTPWELAEVSLRYCDHYLVEIKIKMPAEEGLRVDSILRHRADAARREAVEERTAQGQSTEPWPLPSSPREEDPTTPQEVVEPVLSISAYRARAVMEACETIANQLPVDTSGLDRHLLVLHADADDLAQPEVALSPGHERPRQVPVRLGTTGRRAAMDPRVLRRLACQARYAVVGEGDLPGVSGSTGAVPPRLRRMLDARDRHCRFAGCAATRHVEAHHIIHQADGGPTELANLVLLCRFHHQFVHRKVWEILHDGRGHFRFEPPGELPAPTVLPLPGASAEALPTDPDRDPDVLRPTGYEHRPDYSEAVALLLDAIDRCKPPHPSVPAVA